MLLIAKKPGPTELLHLLLHRNFLSGLGARCTDNNHTTAISSHSTGQSFTSSELIPEAGKGESVLALRYPTEEPDGVRMCCRRKGKKEEKTRKSNMNRA